MWVESARRGEEDRAVAPRRMMGALTRCFRSLLSRAIMELGCSLLQASAFVCQLRCRGYNMALYAGIIDVSSAGAVWAFVELGCGNLGGRPHYKYSFCLIETEET